MSSNAELRLPTNREFTDIVRERIAVTIIIKDTVRLTVCLRAYACCSRVLWCIAPTSPAHVSLACLFCSLVGTNSQGPQGDAVLSQEVHGKNDLLVIASFLVHTAVTVRVNPFVRRHQ